MRKQIYRLTLAVAMTVAAVPLAWAQATLGLGTVSAQAGANVAVPVDATGFANIQGFQFTIDFDESRLTYVNCSDWGGGTAVNGVQITPLAGQGKITFVYNDNLINISSGLFFNLNFTVNAGATGTAPIAWSDVPTPREISNDIPDEVATTYSNGEVNITTGGGDVVITGNTITGGGQSLCAGAAAAALNGTVPTDADGSALPTVSYQWESSTAGAGGPFANAAGASTGQNYTPGTLSVTTWFRRVATSGTAQDVSNVAQITVNPLPAQPVITQNGDQLTTNATGNLLWSTGGTSQTITPPSSGSYTVTVTDVNGCSSTSAPFSYTAGGGGSDCGAPVLETACYGDNDYIVYTYQQVAGAADSLTVSILGVTEEGFDFITVYDGLDDQSPVLYNASGFHDVELTSGSGYLTVVIESDESVSCGDGNLCCADGLFFEFGCGEPFVDPFDCSVNPSETVTICYGNNADIQNLFLAFGGETLSIELAGGTEEDYDFVSIYDGTSTADPLLYTGSGDLTGVSVESTSGFLLVQVESDFSISCAAGNAEYELDVFVFCGSQVIVGVEDLGSESAEMMLMPNPNNGVFTVQLPYEGATLEVLSTTGQVVYRATANGTRTHEADMQHVAAGVYTLVARGEKGVSHAKFIKQ